MRRRAQGATMPRSSGRALGLLLLLLLRLAGPSEAAAAAAEAGPATPVLRCCPAGEDLTPELGCAPSAQPFRPLIYSPEGNDYLAAVPASWGLLEAARPACGPGRAPQFVPHSKYSPLFVLFDSGEVAYEAAEGLMLGPGEYCLGARTLLACLPRRNGSRQAAATMRPRLRKCCGESAAYERSSCVVITGESAASLEEDRALLLGVGTANGNASLAMEIVSGFPVCPVLDNFTIIGSVAEAALQPDASVVVEGQRVPTEGFCIERLREGPGRQLLPAKIFACSEHASKGSGVAVRDIRFTLYPVGFIVSAIFLAATLAAGWLLPASHHALHWRCQTHHVACLMLGDICMAIIQLAGNSLQGELCRALAILAHFFFLATFFWLNTMCFNIWWTFRDLRPASLEKGQELLRLRFYAAYAWGGPLIVAGLAAFLDHLPQSPGQTFLRPRFGEKQCWFYGDMEILAYFFGPIGVLLAINLLFFAATARELTCGLWKGEFVKSTTERSRAIPRTSESARDRRNRRAALGKVCLKLVVVMGVPWIFDVISWLAGGPDFLWYVTDLCNAAQGVLIFIVVGCQPQVRAALKRLWSRNPRANANRQGNGLSTTSHGMPSMGDSVTQNPSTKTAPLETIC